MSLRRRTREEGDDATPPTRSYVDALLQGDMTEAELSVLAAQVSGEMPAPGEQEVDEARTAFHAYTPEEQRDPDDAHTAFHSYSDAEQLAAFGAPLRAPSSPAGPLLADEDDDDPRTLLRPSNAPRAISPSSPAPAGTRSSAPPRARSGGFRIRPSGASPATGGSAPPPRSQTPVPSSPRRNQPVVDIGELLDDPLAFALDDPLAFAADRAFGADVPSAPPSGPKSAEEVPISVGPLAVPSESVPISVPSLRTHQVHAIDDSYIAVLGGPNGVLHLAISPSQLTSLPLGPQVGFLVSCIDGVSSVDEIIDISGQSRTDTLRSLWELLQQGVIAVSSR